jgi:alpha-tubulin suppressor-like RCC1 family protein
VGALRHVRIAAGAAGLDRSLALAEDGAVFSWGRNNGGQLGLGRRGGDEALPQKAEALSRLKVWAVVAAGCDVSSAVTAAGELYMWGGRADGRLGHGGTAAQLAPKRVEALQDECVVAVSAGITPLRPHEVAACSAVARRMGSACQKLPLLCPRPMKDCSSCCRVVTLGCRVCRAPDHIGTLSVSV